MLASRNHVDLYRRYYEEHAVARAPSLWLPEVERIARSVGARTVVDYGCGAARGLSFSKELSVTDYDPALPGLELPPSMASHDMVASVHMLEHVEPDALIGVVKHMEAVATKAVLAVVSLRASTKTLPDGSPWHSIVKTRTWWLTTLGRGYVELEAMEPDREVAALWVKQ